MCLYTFQRKPIIAEKDIVVNKVLLKDNKKYFTPFQLLPVELNSFIIGDTEIEPEEDLNGRFRIGKGFIHSYTDVYEDSDSMTGFSAIIPKGTPFYINFFGDEVASKRLFITSEEYTSSTFIYKDGLRVGDILSSDNLIHLEDYKDEKVDAIFAGFYNNKPLYVEPSLTKKRPNDEQAKVVNNNLGLINYTLHKLNLGTVIPREQPLNTLHMSIIQYDEISYRITL